MLTNVRIVLVATSHPGNIGAVARAMKSMQLSRLFLVKPKVFPHAEATARAAGADDILANAQVVATLEEAINNCSLVMGSSARIRAIPTARLLPSDAAPIIVQEANQHEVALVFGRENNGLSNEELEQCQFHIHIPTNPEFSSLNLAQAVQIIAYEIQLAINTTSLQTQNNIVPLANNSEINMFFAHLKQTLIAIKFLREKSPGKLMQRLQRLFNRTRLEKTEVNILRGILTAIQEYKGKN